ncbi:hypothetical protein PPERSA_01370 [Pseudocohnilembus persalinus]|uniref:Kinase domain protein n=1 Tax=Pseudocohnilembus persalinus TaxID=266149 RepID=A0A0V0QGZ7_PSEPJ|nr:hypothetical protein PPERSA_01370 [Pseudocohnilembus persalinus]|eukprot:KRX01467.1 hypothetical protein PPERSA_01370 [Pseudocohnilembus persalinus]
MSARNFALAIQKFQNLQQFSFILRANNKLNEKGTEEIFTVLGKQTQIEVLQIVIEEENQFNDKQFNLVCDCFQYFKKLEHLLIKIGGFSQLENQTEILGQSLKKISALKSFYLKIGQSSQFGQQGLAYLGEGLSMHQNLKQLSIQFGRKNFENGQGYIDFGKNLQKISQLEKFSLILDDSNQLEGQQMVETFEAIGNQKNLKNLQIQINNNNEISKESGQQLGKSMQNLQQLEFLDIYLEKMNEQGKEILSFISGGLKDKQNLQILNLKLGNSFLGQFYKKEKSLAIVVQENQLCGQKGADQISQAIEGQKKMIQNFQLQMRQRGDFFNNICGFLPLMKDFSTDAIDLQQNQFGFGVKKQIQNHLSDLFETEQEFQDNFDDIDGF